MPPFLWWFLFDIVHCLLDKLVLILGTLPPWASRGVIILQYDLQNRVTRDVIIRNQKITQFILIPTLRVIYWFDNTRTGKRKPFFSKIFENLLNRNNREEHRRKWRSALLLTQQIDFLAVSSKTRVVRARWIKGTNYGHPPLTFTCIYDFWDSQ